MKNQSDEESKNRSLSYTLIPVITDKAVFNRLELHRWESVWDGRKGNLKCTMLSSMEEDTSGGRSIYSIAPHFNLDSKS